ncbi:hypothetical protein AB0O01_00100 [Streptomyces sp. NPDC093252]|uniref:hypothetical protein n=1 Tax=Streptomyces sp. NPDC093252 TaxID=3154980 RepID=UPI00342AF5CD
MAEVVWAQFLSPAGRLLEKPVSQVRQERPYSADDYELFHQVIKALDEDLRLHQHRPGDLLKLAAHLHRRTGGYMKPLSYLVCQSAQEAIETGTEAITKELLDNQLVGRFDDDPILQI